MIRYTPRKPHLTPLLFLLLLACPPLTRAADAPPPAQTGASVANCAAARGARSDASQLLQLHDVDKLSRIRLEIVLNSTVTQLVQQNLRALDPDGRLQGDALRELSRTLNSDIRPSVARAVHAVDRKQLLTALTTQLSQLSCDDRTRLLQYYHSAAGRRYLVFSAQLDAILLDAISQISQRPFIYSRSQQPDEKLQAQRRALLSMTTVARQLVAANAAGTHHPAGAAIGIVSELLAIQSSVALDRLARQNAADLPGFIAFQQSPAAQHEIDAVLQWSVQSSALFTPALQQASHELAAHQAKWRQLAAQLLAQLPVETKSDASQ